MSKPRKKMTLAQFTRLGGLARAAALTAARRSEIARRANAARKINRAFAQRQQSVTQTVAPVVGAP